MEEKEVNFCNCLTSVLSPILRFRKVLSQPPAPFLICQSVAGLGRAVPSGTFFPIFAPKLSPKLRHFVATFLCTRISSSPSASSLSMPISANFAKIGCQIVSCLKVDDRTHIRQRQPLIFHFGRPLTHRPMQWKEGKWVLGISHPQQPSGQSSRSGSQFCAAQGRERKNGNSSTSFTNPPQNSLYNLASDQKKVQGNGPSPSPLSTLTPIFALPNIFIARQKCCQLISLLFFLLFPLFLVPVVCHPNIIHPFIVHTFIHWLLVLVFARRVIVVAAFLGTRPADPPTDRLPN